jgi:hypothetical protein
MDRRKTLLGAGSITGKVTPASWTAHPCTWDAGPGGAGTGWSTCRARMRPAQHTRSVAAACWACKIPLGTAPQPCDSAVTATQHAEHLLRRSRIRRRTFRVLLPRSTRQQLHIEWSGAPFGSAGINARHHRRLAPDAVKSRHNLQVRDVVVKMRMVIGGGVRRGGAVRCGHRASIAPHTTVD